jgi:hypothetical protein
MASLSENQFGSVPPNLDPSRFERSSALFGSGHSEALFGGSSVTPAPWPGAGKRKDGSHHNKDLIREHLSKPPVIESIDPRFLHATQPSVVREYVDAYMGPAGERYAATGQTVRDQGNIGNQWPTVYQRADGRRDILTGHHRASKALLRGESLQGRIIRE